MISHATPSRLPDCVLVALAILCTLLPDRPFRGVPTSRIAFGFITAAFLTTLVMFIFDYKFCLSSVITFLLAIYWSLWDVAYVATVANLLCAV